MVGLANPKQERAGEIMMRRATAASSSRANDAPRSVSRREFLAYASIFGWIPFLRPKHISLAGARFRITRYGHSNRHYLVIHGNEETAREVLTAHMRAHQGIALHHREPHAERAGGVRANRPEPDVFPRRRRGQPEAS